MTHIRTHLLPLHQAIATLVNIASLDRPEEKIKGLPRIVAESIGRDINDVYRGANMGDVRAMPASGLACWLIDG